jgi:ABC-2 type transport system ATP-binding protein
MGEWAAEYYASRGYVALAFTVRGWFGAGGEIGCMDPEREMRDVSCIIDLLARDDRLPLREDGKGPVVGITGASMGGCFSYLMSERRDPRPGDPCDPRIRAAVPMHGSFDLIFSLYPNNVMKFLWVTLLLFSAYSGKLSGFMVSLVGLALDKRLDNQQKLGALLDRLLRLIPPVSNVDPELLYLYGVVTQRRKAEEEYARHFFKVRSARYWCDEEYDGVVEHPIVTPTLILAGWNDDLFFANEGLMAYEHITAPKRIIITNHGHLGCYPGPFPLDFMTGSPESAWVREQVDRWFDRFLKGVDNGVDLEPPLAFYRHTDPENYGQADAYPLPGTEQLSLYLGGRGKEGYGTLVEKKPGNTGAYDLLINTGLTGWVSLPYIQDAPQMTGGDVMEFPSRMRIMRIPFTEAIYFSEPLKEDLTIMGPPRFELFYRSSAKFTQLIPWLYEVTADGREILVSRGFFEGYTESAWQNGNSGGPLEMQACYHRFRAGSRIRLEFSTADLLSSWPYWGLNIIHLLRTARYPSRIILPVVPDSY